MISQQVAPLTIKSVDPGVTRDSAGFGVATDGQSYVIKSPSKHALLPGTEAFCETIAVACGLPATTGAWVDVNGESCYGSRFEGGLNRPMKRGTYLEIAARKRDWKRCTNPGVATATFALDLFLFNFDRHHNNWAFQDQNGNRTARIFDFSRAWWVLASNPADLPSPASMKVLDPNIERTCAAYRDVRKWAGEDLMAGAQVLDYLRKISPNWVESQIKMLPQGWVDQKTLDETMHWWAGPLRLERIDHIDKGLKNGSLF